MGTNSQERTLKVDPETNNQTISFLDVAKVKFQSTTNLQSDSFHDNWNTPGAEGVGGVGGQNNTARLNGGTIAVAVNQNNNNDNNNNNNNNNNGAGSTALDVELLIDCVSIEKTTFNKNDAIVGASVYWEYALDGTKSTVDTYGRIVSSTVSAAASSATDSATEESSTGSTLPIPELLTCDKC